MILNVRNHYPCTASRFWEMYWDPAFDELLSSGSNVRREALWHRREAGVEVRRVRFSPDRQLPPAAAKLIGTSKIVYEQENRWDKANGVLYWQVFPSVMAHKVAAKGNFVVTDEAGGCEQVVTGEVSVKIRFIGAKIEHAIGVEVEKSYTRFARLAERWLAQS